MRVILLFLFGIFLIQNTKAQPFPAKATAAANQYIRDAPSTSGGIITSIAPSQYIMVYAISSGWYKVYFAAPTGIVVGYSLSGTGYLVSDACHSYVTVHNTLGVGLNIRTAAGTGSPVVTIGSSTAKGWDGEEFVCTGNTSVVSGSTWYEIYLTNNCSALTGWVSNGYGTGDDYLLYTSVTSGAPSTPSGLSAAATSCNSISLTWSTSSGATSYDIYTCSGSSVGTSTTASYPISGLSPSTPYSYKVRANNSCASSAFGVCQGATTPACTVIPPVPTGLAANALSCSTIVLTWSPSSGATSYDISTCAGGLITTVTAPTATYTVTGLSASTPYSYMVRATNSTGSSSYCSCQGATTPICGSVPAIPTGLAASATSCSTMVLTWSPVSGAASYDISICSGSLLTTVTAPVATYTVTGLSASTPYSYMIRATNSFGSSSYCSCQGATTPSCGSSTTPDLTIVSPSVNITDLVPNASTQITYTIKNLAAGSSAPSVTSFFLSNSSTYTPGDSWLKDDNVLSIAGTGSTSPHLVTVTIPPGTAPGTYYITIIADAPASVAELDETNNTSFVAINVGNSLQCNTDDYPFRTSLGFSNAECMSGDCAGDPWLLCKHYCTSYVAWKVNQFHGVTSTSLSNPSDYPFNNYMYGSGWPTHCTGATATSKLGDACYWDDVFALNGISVDNIPAVGAIAHWNPDDPGMTATGVGHVAFVNAVSGNVVCISNYNGFNSSGAYIKCGFAYFQVDLSQPYSSTNRIPGRFIHVEANGLGAATSVKNIEGGNKFEIFPNPSTGKINVICAELETGEGSIYVYDMTGRLIESITLNKSKTYDIDLTGRPSGLYIIQMNTNLGRTNKKFELVK